MENITDEGPPDFNHENEDKIETASVPSQDDDDEDSNEHTVKPIIPLYSILEDAEFMVHFNSFFRLPDDNLANLYAGTNMTKGEFARDLAAVFKRNNILLKGESEIFSVLNKYFSQIANLPMKLSTRKKQYVSTLNDYSEPECSFKSYDICRKSCCVFVGALIESTECPECGESRYRSENSKNKTAYKHLYYKPIIPLLHHLILQPGFIIPLNYKYQYKNPNSNKSYKYTDISDGENFKIHMKSMEENYKKKCNQKEIISVPILLSEFYDGVIMNKRKVSFICNYNLL